MSISSLPHASRQQVDVMQKKAQEMMERDGVMEQAEPVQAITNLHPMLQHHEEPSMQIESEDPDLPGEVEEEYEEEVQEVVAAPQESSQQMNFRMIRERAERAERERDEAMKYAMSFNQPKPQTKQAEPEEDYSDIGLDDDGLAEGKHLKKVLKEMRELKKEMQTYKMQSTNDAVELKLKSHYPDLDQVITSENLQAVRAMNPDLADMINQTPDLYKRAKLAYDMVKQLGIYKDRSYSQDKAIAQKNAAKPRPLASVSPQQGDTPLSKANAFANGELSKDIKQQHYKEMLAAMKGR